MSAVLPPCHVAPDTSAPTLLARTREIPDADLLEEIGTAGAGGRRPMCWIRDGRGLVGGGVAARLDLHGPDRFARAAEWWRRTVSRARVTDPVGRPGTGLTAFAAFAFSALSGWPSSLIVPAWIRGRDEHGSWETRIRPLDGVPADASPSAGGRGRPGPAEVLPGRHTAAEWPGIVARGVEAIHAGRVEKVVLARDAVVALPDRIDAGRLLARLGDRQRRAWTFCVDGFLGATPELLASVRGREVTSRVLAGTYRPAHESRADAEGSARFAASAKERGEHALAVASLEDTLRPLCTDFARSAEPYLLRLPQVWHLATDVRARLARHGGAATSLEVAAAVHPTAAVCGTPTDRARELIAELEDMDRGRYAGPVGWFDASGDGDWGVGIRSGQLDRHDPRRLRVFAGSGIVAASDPDAELAETRGKMRAMLDALGVAEG